MRITRGLFEGQVLQRNRRDVGRVRAEGECCCDGIVESRVTKNNRTSGWRKSGVAKNGNFKLGLDNIPAGGPCTVELRITSKGKTVDAQTIKDVFVGDVWFMGGQSNMQGIGFLKEGAKPNPMVRCFYMRDEWGTAKDPLHFLQEAVDMIHHKLAGRDRFLTEEEIRKEREVATQGVGPGVFFGIEMYKRTGVPQGLVSCAHGGTSMAQWSPSLKKEGGNSLYGAMVRRFKKLGQPLAGILWYQGESDSGAETEYSKYTERMKDLVASTRKDFGIPDLPWCVVQIGRVVSADSAFRAGWNIIQEQQRILAETMKNLEVVPALDLTLVDAIHVDSKGYGLLGKRLADCAEKIYLKSKSALGAIRLNEVKFTVTKPKSDREPSTNVVSAVFDNVKGGLKSQGRPTGFSLASEDGKGEDLFYDVRIDKNKVLMKTSVPMMSIEHLNLYYGWGCNPYVNVRDSRGMGVPMFGPISIVEASGSKMMLDWKVRKTGEKIGEVKYRKESGGKWSKPVIGTSEIDKWLVMPVPIDKPREGVYLLKTAFTASKNAKVKIGFGADSPFKLWLNGKEVMKDLKAVNPCVPDEYVVPVNIRKGKNEVLVAFDVRNGQGWGICCRIKPVLSVKKIDGKLIRL